MITFVIDITKYCKRNNALSMKRRIAIAAKHCALFASVARRAVTELFFWDDLT
jgi:hypothetical protein